jgi:hypothetical protein
MPDQASQQHEIESRVERARQQLFDTLNGLRTDTLSDKEADAVAAAIEDELIALRVTLFESQG